jgi:hypothetical protein
MSVPALATNTALSDRVAQFLERVDYRLAASAEERDAIYRLRYESYLQKGAIQPNLNRRVIDAYDNLPNAWIFAVCVDDKLASSFRMHVSSEDYPQLPALQVFADLLQPELDAGKTLIDHTRFVTDPTGNQYPELPYATVRLGYMAAEYFTCDIGVAVVRDEHQHFYRRVFGYRLRAEPRAYPQLTKPFSLMTVDFRAEQESMVRRYPFFRSTAFERRMLFGRSPALLAEQSAA